MSAIYTYNTYIYKSQDLYLPFIKKEFIKFLINQGIYLFVISNIPKKLNMTKLLNAVRPMNWISEIYNTIYSLNNFTRPNKEITWGIINTRWHILMEKELSQKQSLLRNQQMDKYMSNLVLAC